MRAGAPSPRTPAPAEARQAPATTTAPPTQVAEPRRCDIVVVRTTTKSSLKERAGVKRGLSCGFAVAAGFAGHDGMASRMLCSGWCPLVRAGRRIRHRAETGRRGGAAGILDAQAGEPDHGGPGESRRRGSGVMRLW